MQSQLAYDLAVKGPIRPINSKTPILYGINCISFDGPEFTLGWYNFKNTRNCQRR